MIKEFATRSADFDVEIDNEKIKLYIVRPNQQELFEIDMAHRAAHSKLLRGGVMTQVAAEKYFAEEGSWSQKEDQDVKNATVILAHLYKTLNENKNKQTHEENMGLVEKIKKARTQQISLLATKNHLFENTVERRAEEQKIHRFAELCCCHAGGTNRYFTDPDIYRNFVREHPAVAGEIYGQTHKFEYGFSDDLTEGWADVEYLRGRSEEKKADSVVKDIDGAVEQAEQEVAKKRSKKSKKKKE